METQKKKDEIEDLLNENSEFTELLLLPWCDGSPDCCKKADFKCNKCKSEHKERARKRAEEDFRIIKDSFN